jgi:Peptidase_C39 like family
MLRRVIVLFGLAAGLLLASASPALAVQPYPLNFQTVDFNSGTMHGLVLNSDGTLQLANSGLDPFTYTDPFSSVAVLGHTVDGSGAYVSGTWTSPIYSMSFPFNELVSSWNSKTPSGTWIQSEVRPKIDDGHWANWYILGRWAYNDFVDGSGDPGFHRTSVGGQGNADGFVSIDTFFTKDHPAVAYQLRLTIFRRAGLTDAQAPVRVSRYSAVASNLTNQQNTFPSPTDMQRNHPIDLEVTPFSQETHHGEYPEFDNGGEAWCSPTSTAMVLNYWTRVKGIQYAPSAAETSWVNPAFADPEVDYTARYVYDYHYQGAGNWPFNTAYAAERGLVSDVTQLHNLREAEPFIRAQIPLVASVAWHSNKLDGGIKSTNGHLMVIGGFTDTGDVIAYDPASPDNAHVRHVYNREQFEKAWIPASGGIVYVDRPVGWATPSLTANNN